MKTQQTRWSPKAYIVAAVMRGSTLRAVIVVVVQTAAVSACVLFLHPPMRLVAPYSMLAFFQYYMTLHLEDFRGNWLWFKTILAWFAFASMIFAYGFLAYVWYRLGFMAVVAVAATSFMIGVLLSVAEFMLRPSLSEDLPYFISLGGFVAIPLLGYLCIARLP